MLLEDKSPGETPYKDRMTADVYGSHITHSSHNTPALRGQASARVGLEPRAGYKEVQGGFE